jgi:hypothetical protein
MAQSNQWQLTLSTGDILPNCALLKVDGDSLNVTRDSTNQWIKVASISEVRFVRESRVWESAKTWGTYVGLAGAVVSAVAIASSVHGRSDPPSSFLRIEIDDTTAKIFAALLGSIWYGAILGVVGGVVGSVVALVTGRDIVYDLAPMKLNGKLTTLHAIIENRTSN